MSDADEEIAGEVEEEEEELDLNGAIEGQDVSVRAEEPSESAEKLKKKKKKKPPPIRINLTGCKYEVLRVAQRRLGWKEVDDSDDWEVYWTDTSISMDRVSKLSKFQKINHFSGLLELCCKRLMAKILQKMPH
eukprot:gene19089-25690_t